MRLDKMGPSSASPTNNRGNRYSALAEFLPLPVRPPSHIMVTPSRVPTINRPSSSNMTVIGSIPKVEGPFQYASSKALTSSRTGKILTSSDYEMKTPESFVQAVKPDTPSKIEGKKVVLSREGKFRNYIQTETRIKQGDTMNSS